MTCADGEGLITIDGEEYILTEGQSIVMSVPTTRTQLWAGTV